jgi:hypothetical protein
MAEESECQKKTGKELKNGRSVTETKDFPRIGENVRNDEK